MYYKRMRTACSLPQGGSVGGRGSVQGGLCPGGLLLCPVVSVCLVIHSDKEGLHTVWSKIVSDFAMLHNVCVEAGLITSSFFCNKNENETMY